MLRQFFYACLLLSSLSLGQSADFLSEAPHHARILASISTSCRVKVEVDARNLNWPFQEDPPWTIHKETRIWISDPVSEAITSILGGSVPGLPGYTYNSALREFQSKGCAIFLHGGSVRDVYLGKNPHDIDVEYTCTPQKFEEICKNTFGELCRFTQKTSKFELGPEGTIDPLEGVWWESTAKQPSYVRDFTINTLSYDLENRVTYDFYGGDLNDVCSKTLKIPGPQEQWEKWLNESDIFKSNGIRKLARYFKFSGGDFVPTRETQKFVIDEVKRLWNHINRDLRASDKFKDFLCASISGRVKKNQCIVQIYPSPDTMKKRQETILSMKEQLGVQFVDSNVIKVGMLDFTSRFPRELLNQRLFIASNLNHNLRGLNDGLVDFTPLQQVWEEFEIHEINGSNVLRNVRLGRYIGADTASVYSSADVRKSELWEFEFIYDDVKYAIKNLQTGRYLSYRVKENINDGGLAVMSERLGEAEKFSILSKTNLFGLQSPGETRFDTLDMIRNTWFREAYNVQLSEITFYVSDYGLNNPVIAGIKGTFKNIRTNDTMSFNFLGSKSGSPQPTIHFSDGEFILEANVLYYELVDRITFQTSKGRSESAGGRTSKEANFKMNRIIGFYGAYNGYIQNIGFYYI